MDGFEVLRRLRMANVQTPITILPGLSNPEDKIKGLDIGADDYLTKPFDKNELVARIQSIVRRSKVYAQSIIRTGKLWVDLDRWAARGPPILFDPLLRSPQIPELGRDDVIKRHGLALEQPGGLSKTVHAGDVFFIQRGVVIGQIALYQGGY